MMCCYLNVQFQGQRVKPTLVQKFSIIKAQNTLALSPHSLHESEIWTIRENYKKTIDINRDEISQKNSRDTLFNHKRHEDSLEQLKVGASWNMMARAHKPHFVFRRNGRVHLNRRRCQFSRLLAAEVCFSVVVMLDTSCSEIEWRVLATHFIHQFSLHFHSRASPCAITFQLESKTSWRDTKKIEMKLSTTHNKNEQQQTAKNNAELQIKWTKTSWKSFEENIWRGRNRSMKA